MGEPGGTNRLSNQISINQYLTLRPFHLPAARVAQPGVVVRPFDCLMER
jgi:hypothetical protein